jgi:hypothetical protein
MGKLFKGGSSRASSNIPTPHNLRCTRISSDKKDVCALWYQGSEDLFYLDSQTKFITAVKLSGHRISSVRFCGRVEEEEASSKSGADDWLVNSTSTEGIAISSVLRIPYDGSHPSIRLLTENIDLGATQSRQVVSGFQNNSDASETAWSCDTSAAATVQSWNDPHGTLSCRSWMRSGIRAGALPQLIDIRDSFVSNDTAYSGIVTTDGSLPYTLIF